MEQENEERSEICRVNNKCVHQYEYNIQNTVKTVLSNGKTIKSGMISIDYFIYIV